MKQKNQSIYTYIWHAHQWDKLLNFKLKIVQILFYFDIKYLKVLTSEELNLTGNCIKGSRPVLSFDAVNQ